MKVDFSVDQNCNGLLTITGESTYNETEDYQSFKYEDSVTINIVTYEGSKTMEFVATSHNLHTTYLDETHLQTTKDGLYNITQLIVPSVHWYERESHHKINNFHRYDKIFVSDGKNLYLAKDSTFEIVDELNFITNIDLNRTTVSKHQKIAFLTCFLWKCYISLANEVLTDLLKNNQGKGKISKCGNENEDTKDKIYRRDFVWATINVLKYLTDQCKFEEAQKILEQIQGCNGFCTNFGEEDFSSFIGEGLNLNFKKNCGCNS